MIWILCLGVLSLIAIISGFLPAQSDSGKTIHFSLILKLMEFCLGLCLLYWLIWFMTDIRFFNFSAFYLITVIGILVSLAYPIILKILSIKKKSKILPFTISMLINLFLLLSLIPFINYFVVFKTLNSALGFEREIIFKSEEYILERGTSFISSGGQFEYSVFQRHSIYEKKIDSFHGYPKEVETQWAFMKSLSTKLDRNN